MFVRDLFPVPFYDADGGSAGGGTDYGVNNNQDQNGQGVEEGHDQNKNVSDDSQKKTEPMIPKSRFDEVNNKLKELQEQLENVNKQKQQEELEAKKKKGEFEELYNNASQELETVKTDYQKASERVEQLEGIIQTLVDSELEAVPEEFRDLVPENFTPEQKLSWITNAKKKGLFGKQESKEDEPLGSQTNSGGHSNAQPDVSKMSITELFRSAYGAKK